MENFLEAGRIVRPHGVRGEVKVEPWADSADCFRRFEKLYIGGEPRRIVSCKLVSGFPVVGLEGVDTLEAAEALRGQVVSVAREDAPLPEGRVYIADMMGARVVSDAGEELGVLKDVLNLPGGDVYVVRGQREILIPARDEFILAADAEKGVLTVHLIEGM